MHSTLAHAFCGATIWKPSYRLDQQRPPYPALSIAINHIHIVLNAIRKTRTWNSVVVQSSILSLSPSMSKNWQFSHPCS